MRAHTFHIRTHYMYRAARRAYKSWEWSAAQSSTARTGLSAEVAAEMSQLSCLSESSKEELKAELQGMSPPTQRKYKRELAEKRERVKERVLDETAHKAMRVRPLHVEARDDGQQED